VDKIENKLPYRIRLLIWIIILIPIGLATKKYGVPVWINHHAGGLIYEIFWCLAISLFWPKLNGWKIAAWIFSVTCFLECLQLWHPPFLESVRLTFLGRALIGTTFSWWDFPYYVLGSGLGGLIIERLKKEFLD